VRLVQRAQIILQAFAGKENQGNRSAYGNSLRELSDLGRKGEGVKWQVLAGQNSSAAALNIFSYQLLNLLLQMDLRHANSFPRVLREPAHSACNLPFEVVTPLAIISCDVAGPAI
jgi:hypothetical protein